MVEYEVIRFTAPWCGPCKQLKPIYEEIVAENDNSSISYSTIDVDEDSDAAAKYAVRGIPTIIGLKDGEEAMRLVGFRDKDAILSSIEELLSNN